MRKTKEEAAITREKLLHIALSVFSTRGYSSTTLEDIARKAKVTRGAIYWHFGSKAELYNSLLSEFSAQGSLVAQQAIAEGGPFKEILGKIFVRLLSAVEDDRELRAVMEMALFKTGISKELKAGREQQIEASRGLMAGIAEAMSQGITSGDLRSDLDPQDMARSFMAFQNGVIYLWLSDPDSFSLKAKAESFADIFLAGVLPRE